MLPTSSHISLMVITPQLANSSARLTPLSVLASQYDSLLCDIWGVIHNGVAPFDDAVDALCRYRASGRHVVLITNAPRSAKDVYLQLERLGVPREAFDCIVTSGDVTRTLIQGDPDTPLFHFGPARDHSILEGAKNPIVGISDARLCLLTGPLDDAIETVDVYHDLLVEMRDNAVRMICANPDLLVRDGNRMVICAGSIAQRYSQMGGTVIFSGKPEATIYQEARNRVNALANRKIPKSRLLAVGDGMPTDIKGAADSGLDAYFISGGIHADEFGDMNISANILSATKSIESQYSGINLVGIGRRLFWN
ncbi:TIGR01459 family HAD-type hydrolase [Roseovarius sp. S1116L3]|uniref:TIGR01459 family HAD-type hydrolase n=1 Tax=Roseovarius roseus TaxID=3342636 RepID=UPI0037262D81